MHLYDELFRENIYIFVGMSERMEKEFPAFAPFDVDGKTFTPMVKKWPGVCLWIKIKHDWHVLAHEAVHAGNHILWLKGVKLSRLNDEALAYYVQWIMQSFMEAECEKESRKS